MPNNKIASYWKTIVIIIVVFILSTVSFSSRPKVTHFQNSDKIVHLIMYMALAFVAFYDHEKAHNNNKINLPFRWFILCFAVYGALIEVIQDSFFKPRSAEWADWLADVVGLLAGWLIAWICFSKLSRLTNKK